MIEVIHRDLRGMAIEVGDLVIQAYNLGRCAALKYALVTKLNEKSIRCISTVEDGYQACEWPVRPKMKLTSEYTLKYTDRCSIVDRYSIPTEIMVLLENYKLKHIGDPFE